MSRTTKDRMPQRPRAASQYTTFNVYEPEELMTFLLKVMSGISRNKVKALLTGRAVYVDQVITTQYNFALKPGMKVQISKKKGQKEFHSSLLKIVYEDAYLIVVEKREGLLSIATNREKERTAYSILTDNVQRSGRQHRIFIVHRLDKDTSGLMVFAKDEQTKRNLQDHWQEIVTDRRYVAVVSGEVEKNNGTITSWLKDNKVYVTYSSLSNNGGDKAITHYTVIRRANGYSLVELELETGRKNQIRVHMKDLGHPVVGDTKYGNGDDPLRRLALHAFKLWFYHPVTGELMKFETPYPSSFKNLVTGKSSSGTALQNAEPTRQ